MEMSDLTTNVLNLVENSQISTTSIDSKSTEQTANGSKRAEKKQVSDRNNESPRTKPKVTSETSMLWQSWKRARQKKDEKQSTRKSTIRRKETRSSNDKLCYKDTLTDFKDTLKEFEVSEDVIKTKPISKEHLQSFLSIVTKGLLVRSYGHFDLKAQAITYTQQPLCLEAPSLTDDQCEKEFLKIAEMQRWDDTVRSFGLNIDASAHTHSFTFGAPNSVSEEINIATDKEDTNIYLAKAKYAFVPIKSFQLHHSNMRLDATAMIDIQYIGQLIQQLGGENQSVNRSCCDFLNRYGSHVSTGNHHVGGIFKMYTVCNDIETTFNTDYSRTLSREHAMYVGIMMSVLNVKGEIIYSKEKGNQRETTNHEKISTVENNFSRFGGPLDADNFKKWREGLLQDADTWTVIHRSDVTGIWNILLNHKSDIANWAEVGELLQKNWEKAWGNSSKIEIVDKILIHNIKSIIMGIDLTEACTKETVEQLLNKCIRIAGGNKRFSKYTKGISKWIQFLEKAISINAKLSLESRFCLKLLLKITGEHTSNLHESLKKYFYVPLLSCNENLLQNVDEKIKSFIQRDFLQAYTSVGEIVFDLSWKCQVDEQAAIEIALIINHYGKDVLNVTECIYMAEIAIQLPFNFKHFKFEKQNTQERSPVETNKTVANFFSSISKLKQDDTSLPGNERLPQSVDDFVRLIEQYYFPKIEISANIFRRVDQQQLRQTIFCKMAALCRDMLETSYQVQIDFVKLALASVLWSDLFKNKSMQLEEFKKIFFAGKIIWCHNEKIERLQELSCSDFLTFVPGFISTIETYKKKDAKFEQIGVDCCMELFDRFHALLFMNELDDRKRKNCIQFAFILAKARQALSIKNIFAINTFDNVKKILKELEKSNSEVSEANIPTTEIDFVNEVRICFIPIWRAMEHQLQGNINKQKAAGHIRDYFVVELTVICQKSCRLSTEVSENDIRKQLAIILSKSPSSIFTWRDLDEKVKVITSCPRKFMLTVKSFFQSVFKGVRNILYSFCVCCSDDNSEVKY
ncbi:unnamed protein product [Mytilus coruscus]|uniref:MACPF domain-containing protein n=1 Tax=Mytilus coruscus TaxID=42192 RepID=A0A6J8C5A2_MYTCO|nr:unnamed protein product [Mytilus coruscus]